MPDSRPRYFYRPVPAGTEREGHNFDHPSALDDGRMVATLSALRGGEPVTLHEYDYGAGAFTDAQRTLCLAQGGLLILEGLLVLSVPAATRRRPRARC